MIAKRSDAWKYVLIPAGFLTWLLWGSRGAVVLLVLLVATVEVVAFFVRRRSAA